LSNKALHLIAILLHFMAAEELGRYLLFHTAGRLIETGNMV
jgi:hypothetical protein